ncbi:MAG TPA: response regulator transcription factor [Candidatus Acidoferrales bacterium]
MKRVLIVDDNPSVRSALRLVLEGSGKFCVCGEAVDGIDCVEKSKELQPDVIVLDLSMPRMNGAEAASLLHGVNPKMKIVLFSLYSELIGHQLASAIGVDAVISKREGIERLIQLIAEPGELPN